MVRSSFRQQRRLWHYNGSISRQEAQFNHRYGVPRHVGAVVGDLVEDGKAFKVFASVVPIKLSDLLVQAVCCSREKPSRGTWRASVRVNLHILDQRKISTEGTATTDSVKWQPSRVQIDGPNPIARSDGSIGVLTASFVLRQVCRQTTNGTVNRGSKRFMQHTYVIKSLRKV
jgi:hypothetical protein